MHTKSRQMMQALTLAGLAAAAVLAISGCCSDKHCKPCHCMDKNMSGKMMNDGKMMPEKTMMPMK
jgi:hypothetical protein